MKRCSICPKLKNVSFLQGHYNRYRDAGGDHTTYSILNDLRDHTAKDLYNNYEKTHIKIIKARRKKEKTKKNPPIQKDATLQSHNPAPIGTRNDFPNYYERVCDKCLGHVWTDENVHYCGGTLH